MTHRSNFGILTDEEAENLGTGMTFGSHWDFDIYAGSIGTVDGLEVLGRDLSFAFQQEVDDEIRGSVLDPDIRAEVQTILTRIGNRDGRVVEDSIDITSIERTDETGREVEVSVKLQAITGERGEFVLTA